MKVKKSFWYGHLSKSEPPRFGQRQVFCYNYFYNAVLRLLNPDFKIDTKFKTAQNRILNMKKGGIRTPSVRFELWKLCILLRCVMCVHFQRVTLRHSRIPMLRNTSGGSNLFGHDITQTALQSHL